MALITLEKKNGRIWPEKNFLVVGRVGNPASYKQQNILHIENYYFSNKIGPRTDFSLADD